MSFLYPELKILDSDWPMAKVILEHFMFVLIKVKNIIFLLLLKWAESYFILEK